MKDRLSRADVEAAAKWLVGRIVDTPVIRSESLDRLAGVRLWLKAENLQTTGSYKIRGALRAVSRIASTGDARGVIAQSTGNHALAVAHAAGRYGLQAKLVLPADAAPIKIDRLRGLGADVLLAGTSLDDRLNLIADLRARTGYVVVDPYDHPDVVAGQGSASHELFEQVRSQGGALDAVVVPVGGGGGVAGACLAAQGRDLAVYGVEPIGCDSLAVSLAAGARVAVGPAPTIADGLRPSLVGELPFEIVRSSIAGVVRVDDAAIAAAMTAALFETRLLIEPSAAAALAGALQLAAGAGFNDIGVLLTGGNVTPELMAGMALGNSKETVVKHG